MPRANTVERRMTLGEVEVRHQDGKPTVIEGYAAVFGKRSQDLGGFVEVVENTAFNKTIKEADVRSLWNHDQSLLLGRNKAGTLDLSVDNSGLYYRVRPPDTQYARDLITLMERGDVTQSSFSFFKVHDRWNLTEDEFPERSLSEVALVDVSPVTYPAYLDATSGIARSAALGELAQRSGMTITDLSDPEHIKEAIKATEDSASRPDWTKRAAYAAQLERIIRED
jgi:HK97 family phage prohead protease